METIRKNYGNSLDSPIFEIMKSAIKLEILTTFMAWSYVGKFWKGEILANSNLELYFSICSEPKYISWWANRAISDIDSKLTGMCENRVRVISHSSQLKMDDATLKTSLRSLKYVQSVI